MSWTEELLVRVRAGERVIELEHSLRVRNRELAAAKTELEEANWLMKKGLDAAARIQRSLLPTLLPAARTFDFAWVFRPCDEIGGDILDVFPLDESHFGFYLLDVVGHGVPAALLAVSLNRLLSPAIGAVSLRNPSSTVGRTPRAPRELATALNQQFQMTTDTSQYFTLLFGVLNIVTGELRLVSAGHPGPLYLPLDGPPQLVEVSGFPIGVVDDPDYEEIALRLYPGDRLLLYSDGVLDADSSDDGRFGTSGIITSVGGTSQSLQEVVHAIDDRLMDWCRGRPEDDVSILAVGVAGPSDRGSDS